MKQVHEMCLIIVETITSQLSLSAHGPMTSLLASVGLTQRLTVITCSKIAVA